MSRVKVVLSPNVQAVQDALGGLAGPVETVIESVDSIVEEVITDFGDALDPPVNGTPIPMPHLIPEPVEPSKPELIYIQADHTTIGFKKIQTVDNAVRIWIQSEPTEDPDFVIVNPPTDTGDPLTVIATIIEEQLGL